jgi:NAD(P)H-dependent FMN reductase
MLVGVATGRAGNLRGIDNMTNMCHYMKMNVLPNKLSISNINHELQEGVLMNENTVQTIKTQIEQFIHY